MVFLHRWKFFSSKGYDLNLHKEQRISTEIIDETGHGAELQPITNSSGELLYIDVINGGVDYGNINIKVIDNLTGETMTIDNNDITLNNVGSIEAISVPNSTSNWSYPSFVYTGDIYFNNEVPINLIESEHIFIIEEVSDGSNLNYVYPRHSEQNATVRWEWSNDDTSYADSNALFMYSVNTDSNLVPYITRSNSTVISLDDGSSDTYITNRQTWRNLSNINNKSAQVNIGLSYDSEGVFERYLELYDYTDAEKPTILAKIKILGEVIPEDERFKTILDNLGQAINAEEEFIFRDSDINEDIPNVKLLNQKRKEFILEHSNIIPYIGSYKAIFNVLNWLGYDDLRLKEYFLNVDGESINFGKYKPSDIPSNPNIRNNNSLNDFLPTSKYKKTNLFGLYYDINRKSNKLDEFGIPITEDAFMFTIEEVLIKLFALKKYLKDRFLPLNARIIDIVGEGIYFERYGINTWSDGTRITELTLTREAKFKCEPENPVTMDLRKLNKYDLFQPAILKPIIDIENGTINSIHVIDPGFGYVGPVHIKFSGGGSHDHADATVHTSDAGSILSVDVTYGGTGYSSAPMLHVTPEPNEVLIIPEMEYYPLGFFDSINNMDNLPDNENVPVGALVTLSTSSFEINWNDIQYPWKDFEFDFVSAELQAVIVGGKLVDILVIDGGNGYTNTPIINIAGGNPSQQASATPILSGGTIIGFNITNEGEGYTSTPIVSTSGGVPVSSMNSWDTIGIGEFYEMEWIISGPRGFHKRKRGRVDELSSYDIIVPYIGSYDVELILYDTDNNWTNSIQNSCFTVSMPEVEMVAFNRYSKYNNIWNDLDIKWDDANFMWIYPTGHNIKWNDADITWDDFEISKYDIENKSNFEEIPEYSIKRVSEADRYVGNLSSVDIDNKILTISNPVTQPRVESGDFIYLRSGENIQRSQVVNTVYKYSVESLDLINPGTYDIKYSHTGNPSIEVIGDWTGYQGAPAQNIRIVIDDPVGGVSATANGKIDGSLKWVENIEAGSGYTKTINNTTPVPIVIVHNIPNIGTAEVYRMIFQPPTGQGGINAESLVLFTGGSFMGLWNGDTVNPDVTNIPDVEGSGYSSAITWARVLDDNGDEVTNLFTPNSTEYKFDTTVRGGISEVTLTSSGEGYISAPNVTVYPIQSVTQDNAVINSSLSSNEPTLTLSVNNINPVINSNWEILREIGRTILINGNHIHNSDTNPSGIKPGQWVRLNKDDINYEFYGLSVDEVLYDNVGLISGITLPGDYTSKFIKGERCMLYKELLINSGTNVNEFEVNSELGLYAENKITIYDPVFDISIISPGYHELTITNTTDNYKQRVLVIHAEEIIINNSVHYVITVDPLDGDLALVHNTSTMYFKYFLSPTVLDEIILTNNKTNIVLNINDWPLHEELINEPTDWLFDYGIISGTHSLKVINIGNEGDDTLISVDDPNSLLWQSSTGFKIGYRNFDEGYATDMLGLHTMNWSNTQVSWDNASHLSWDITENTDYNYCGFRINKISPGGRIKWNEDDVFEFTTINANDDEITRFRDAVDELNNTSSPGLSGFEYYLSDTLHPKIIAISKTPGGDSLGYIEFYNGVEGEYTADPTLSHSYPLNNTNNRLWLDGFYGPDNKPAYWDINKRTYDEYGIDQMGDIGWYPANKLPNVYKSHEETWLSDRIPYLRSVGGSFTWQETFISSSPHNIPVLSTVIFNASNCEIPGKNNYKWKVVDNSTGAILVETVKPFLVWTFSYEGIFDIVLSITDNNGNTNTKTRTGFIKTFNDEG